MAVRASRAGSGEVVVPVVREDVVVDKAVIETERVRVKKSVRTREENVSTSAAREIVDVERVAVNRVVDAPPRVRVEGDTTIIPVLEEVLVVEKRLVLREEVHVRKRRVSETREIRVPLRAEHVEIERTHPQPRNARK